MILDRVTGKPATIYTPPEDRLDTCGCADPTCGCDCIIGNYPCEHGTAGAGCGA